jgi:hypothetical protein
MQKGIKLCQNLADELESEIDEVPDGKSYHRPIPRYFTLSAVHDASNWPSLTSSLPDVKDDV